MKPPELPAPKGRVSMLIIGALASELELLLRLR